MLAICIECSHQRGMGHLFRAMNLIHALEQRGQKYILLVNQDEKALRILEENHITPMVVDLWDTQSDWEGGLIAKYQIRVWLNDRLDTCAETAKHVKNAGILLYTIDDMGEGAAYADGNFASLIFEHIEDVPGKRVYAGSDYLILNPEIAAYRRERKEIKNILVTLGGSDTYGVTLEVISFLKKWQQERADKKVTILLGPGAAIREEVENAIKDTDFTLVFGVPSLMAYFAEFDLAITGGGVTPLEAAASGLPCLIVANELHEIQIGRHMERIGSAVFAGYYKEMNLERIKEIEDVGAMSRSGMEQVSLQGAQRICEIIDL